MPRWVKMFATVAAVLLLLFAFVVITGIGGPHGPGRHQQSDLAGERTER